jgi:predicted phosphodiesterase
MALRSRGILATLSAVSEPMLVLSDVHLSRKYGDTAGQRLAELVSSHPECEIVLAGDVLDLTLDAIEVPLSQSIMTALAPHQELGRALRQHTQGGGRLSLVPGNHDSALAYSTAVLHLRSYFQLQNDHTLQVYPWFLRRGEIHIEHGHLYDPDCAPNHPLADPNSSHEGLGNALMRRFVAPNDAYLFAHKNQTTMSSGISVTIETWGVRAPFIIAHYFRTALGLWLEAGLKKQTVRREAAQGNGRIEAYANDHGVSAESLRHLLQLAPRPTHHSARDVFFRLYFDRLMAAGSLLSGAALLSSAGLGAAIGAVSLVTRTGALTSAGALLSALGAGYLGTNISRTKNRYGDAVIGQLEYAAETIRSTTGAALVVLGHSHVEVNRPGYVNLGSFGYSREGHPYLLVDTQGRHEKCHF